MAIKIRKIRKNRNMSLKQLAAATGLSISYISEIERCKKQPSLETIQVISDALNVSKEGLLTQQPQSIEPGKKIMLLRQSKNISLTELAKIQASPLHTCVKLKREKFCHQFLH